MFQQVFVDFKDQYNIMKCVRFSDSESVAGTLNEEIRSENQRKDKQSEKEASESDKESVASSQFLEHLLECDRLENRHLHINETLLPHYFTSIRNYFDENSLKTNPHNPYQRKILYVNNQSPTCQKQRIKVISMQNSSVSPDNDERRPILTQNSTDLPDILHTDNMSYINTGNRDILSHNPSSRSQEKEELKRLNDRFSSYIQHIRQLGEVSTQIDSSAFLKSTKILEEEINSLKNLYENELDKLRGDVEDLVKEKNSYQIQYNKSKQTAGELEDRLSVEMDRNFKMNDELNVYHRHVATLEAELNSAKIAANRPLAEIEQLQKTIDNLTRENNTWKHRYEHEEMARQEDEDKVQQLMKKLDFNEQVHSQQTKDLHERVETSAATIISLEAKIRELGKVDTNMGELLRQVREASDAELRKYQEDSEEHHSRNISAIRHQLNQDKDVINQFSNDKQNLERLVGDLQTKLRSVEGQMSALQHQKVSLEELVNQERSRAVDQTKLMEKKLQDLQEVLFTKIQEINISRDANIPLKAEIEALKVLLEDEERRLRLPLSTCSPSAYQSSPTTTNVYPTNYSNNYSHPPKPYTPPITSLPYPSKPYSPKLLSQSYNPPLTSSFHDSPDYNTQTCEPLFSDVPHLLDPDNLSDDLVMPTDRYTYESTPSFSRLQCESHTPQSFRPIGPIRATSAPAHSRNVPLVPTGLGQGQDYFDEMFKDLAKDTLQAKLRPKSSPLDRGVTSTHHDYSVATSSSTGDVKILEVNQDGKYIRLVNEGPKDLEFGGYMIQQNVGGHPVAVYRFPPRMKFTANSTITVWSAMNDAILHQPPTDYVWKEQQKWGTGPECTSILCKANGQAIAWTTAAHRFTQNNFDDEAQETSDQADSFGEEESLTELPVDVKTEQVYLRREKQQPPSLSPQKHPHGTSPAISTHPHLNGARSFILGCDSSNRTQTRSQARPDLLNNTQSQRIGSAPQRRCAPQPPTLKGNGILTNKQAGNIRFGPPTPFLSPLQQEFSQSTSKARNTSLVRFTA